MSLDLFFDYMGVRFNGPKAANIKAKFNFDFGNDGGKYLVEVENGVINHTANAQASNADATITISRDWRDQHVHVVSAEEGR
jgi:alkyl sulfatase BDS1-like metallo-beta-lactamase superfamily hydrolase